MTQEMYSIKEAAQVLQVEAHALRYWEEELELVICRNSQGRRVYTEQDIDTFKRVKACKEQGMQLKAIKQMLHGGEEAPARRIIMYRPKDEAFLSREATQETTATEVTTTLISATELEKAEKSRRLQELLRQFIAESVRESSTELLEAMKEGLLKELDYQFRLQEEREVEREKIRIEKEDAHFKELDESLRSAMERRGKRKRRVRL